MYTQCQLWGKRAIGSLWEVRWGSRNMCRKPRHVPGHRVEVLGKPWTPLASFASETTVSTRFWRFGGWRATDERRFAEHMETTRQGRTHVTVLGTTASRYFGTPLFGLRSRTRNDVASKSDPGSRRRLVLFFYFSPRHISHGPTSSPTETVQPSKARSNARAHSVTPT